MREGSDTYMVAYARVIVTVVEQTHPPRGNCPRELIL